MPFFLVLVVGLTFVVAARDIYQPAHPQVTPEGFLNWWSPQNPPVFSAWAYGLWAAIIGAFFLLWWRPFWQSRLIVSWGMAVGNDRLCVHRQRRELLVFLHYLSAAFILIHSFMVSDDPV
jgi:hypothetical protein